MKDVREGGEGCLEKPTFSENRCFQLPLPTITLKEPGPQLTSVLEHTTDVSRQTHFTFSHF